MIIKRVPIVEDKQRLNLVLVQRLHQAIVFCEVVMAALTLGDVPLEIHSHPTKTRVGDHLDLARLRVGEMNVDAEALRNRGGRGRGIAKFAVGIRGAAAQRSDQENKRQDHWQAIRIRSLQDFPVASSLCYEPAPLGLRVAARNARSAIWYAVLGFASNGATT